MNDVIVGYVFISSGMLFMRSSTPDFDASLFRIVMFSWLIVSLGRMKCPFLPLLISCSLKFIL